MRVSDKTRPKNRPFQNDLKSHACASDAVHSFSLLKQIAIHAIGIADSRPVLIICLLLFPLIVLAYYPAKFDDYDIWFHLTYGREYFQNFTWYLDHGQFSWTPAHTEWTYVTWLGSGFLYLIHAAAGVTGLLLLQWLVLIGMITCLMLYARFSGFRMNITLLTALLICLVAIKIISSYIKPEMFTTLFFFATTVIYFHGKQSEEKDLFWIYPLLFLVWANTHGGVVAGLAFLGIVLCVETFARLFLPNQALPLSRYNRLLLFAGLAIPVTLINPHGIVYHMRVLGGWFADIYEIKEYYGHNISYESLWKNLFPPDRRVYWIPSAWSLLLMGLSSAGLLTFYVICKKKLPLAILTLNLFFFLFSMSMGRAVIFYPSVWFCTVVYLIRATGALQFPRKAAPAALLVFIGLCIYTPWTFLAVEGRKSLIANGFEEFVPIKEVQFIKENNLPGPIFNDYLIGGYMIWAMYPEYKVFIDPRFMPYDKTLLDDYFNLGDRYMLQKGGLDIFRNKYKFNIALIHMRQLPLIEWLANSPDWSLVYFDKIAAVLMHRSVLHMLSPEARSMDVGPQRFRTVDNPAILNNLFKFYFNFSANMATEIRNTYERNVSPFYKPKKARLALMDYALQRIREGPSRKHESGPANEQNLFDEDITY